MKHFTASVMLIASSVVLFTSSVMLLAGCVMLFAGSGVSHGGAAEGRLHSDGHRLYLHLAQGKRSFHCNITARAINKKMGNLTPSKRSP